MVTTYLLLIRVVSIAVWSLVGAGFLLLALMTIDAWCDKCRRIGELRRKEAEEAEANSNKQEAA